MTVRIRSITAADTEPCGRILYEAFQEVANHHGFPPDFPTVEFATGIIESLIAAPAIYGVVAERDGHVVGSNFLAEHDPIRAVGPVSVAPAWQGQKIGTGLMNAVIERARGAAGVRLTQDSFNTASLSLYASLDFDARESFALMKGRISGEFPPGIAVRPLEHEDDLTACAPGCAASSASES